MNNGSGQDWVRDGGSGNNPDLPMWKSGVTYRKPNVINDKKYQIMYKGDGSQSYDYLWEEVTYNSSYNDWSSSVAGYGSNWRKYWNEIDYDDNYDDLVNWDDIDDLNTKITVNAALKKITEQSSTASFEGIPAISSRAVDGDTNGVWASDGTITHTNNSTNEDLAWWQVDLGENYDISAINIYNRTDSCCINRLSDFYVLVSKGSMAENPMTLASYTAKISNPDIWNSGLIGGGTAIVNVTGGTTGRFVMIVLSGTESLNIAEVEVMADIKKISVLSNIKNNWAKITYDKDYPTWSTDMVFGTYWTDFWKSVRGDSYVKDSTDTVAELGSTDEWVGGWYYETSQSTRAFFDDVQLDTNDIEFSKNGAVYTGVEQGAITIRPSKIKNDYDIFEFELEAAGLLRVRTIGCAANEKSEIKIYNSLGEKFETAGVPTDGNFEINKVIAAGIGEVDFIASPGTYYANVLNNTESGDTTAFEYTLEVSYDTSIGDEHGNYKELATILTKWDVNDSPLVYFYTETGSVNIPSDDKDFFRFDVPEYVDYPNGGYVRIMSDSPDVSARLLDSSGNELAVDTNIQITSPYTTEDFSGALVKHLTTGTYYIEITGSASSYTLYVDFDDFGDYVNYTKPSLSNQKPFTGYNVIKGHFETVESDSPNPVAFADKDIFELDVTVSSGEYSIYTSGSCDTSAILYDDEGVQVTVDYEEVTYSYSDDIDLGEGNKNFILNVSDLAIKSYYIEVTEAGGKAGDYRLHITQEDDFADDWNCREYIGGQWQPGLTYCDPVVGQLIDGDSPVTDFPGVINLPGDIDYFQFNTLNLPEDRDGRLSITSSGDLDTLAKLYIYECVKEDIDDKCIMYQVKKVAWNSDGAADSEGNFKIEYDVEDGGFYLLSVAAQFPLDTGSYKLSVTHTTTTSGEYEPDEEGDTYANATPILGTNTSASYLNAGLDYDGDYDYYKFDVVGTGLLKVWTETPPSIPPATESKIVDTYGYLYAATGNDGNGDDGMYEYLASNDDDPEKTSTSDGNFSLQYYVDGKYRYDDPEESEPVTRFYVKVKGLRKSDTGNYELHISFDNLIEDTVGDNCATAKSIGPGTWGDPESEIDLAIDLAGDIDFFKFVAGPVPCDPLPCETVNTKNEKGSLLSAETFDSDDLDLFGYLKNSMCGSLIMDDNSGVGVNDVKLSWTQQSDDDGNFFPEIYHVALRDYENKAFDLPYKLEVIANGSFIDWNESAEITPVTDTAHYFGFDVADTSSTLSVTSAGAAGNVDFTLLSGDDGSVIIDAVTGGSGDNFTINHSSLTPGVYYLKVIPSYSSGTLTVSAGDWRWNSVEFDDGSSDNVFPFYDPLNPVEATDLTKLSDAKVMTIEAEGNSMDQAEAVSTDDGYFVYREIPQGDFELSARVIWLKPADDAAKAGIMIRGNGSGTGAAPGAASAYGIFSPGNGFRSQIRETAGDPCNDSDWDSNRDNSYIKILRDSAGSGEDILKIYKSSNGSDWTLADYSIDADLAADGTSVLVGFAVSSTINDETAVAKFEQISFSTKVELY